MKSRLLSALSICATTLVLSNSANADLISYNGYTLNTDTNIVSGGGLEWLQWDETIGLSANDALANYGGWRIASATEMSILINSSNLGITLDPLDMVFQFATPEDSAALNFIELFGDNYLASGTTYPDAYSEQMVSALFSSESFPNLYGATTIEYNLLDNRIGPVGSNLLFTDDGVLTGADSGGLRGVALVRDVAVVPVPAAVWLFGSGLLGLIGVARRKKAA